jgi:hypothetical protein
VYVDGGDLPLHAVDKRGMVGPDHFINGRNFAWKTIKVGPSLLLGFGTVLGELTRHLNMGIGHCHET